MDLTELARALNRQGLSVAPCPWASSLSFFGDEDYENYDYDDLGPRLRRRLDRLLRDLGFRRRGSLRFEREGEIVALPRTPRSVASDPGHEHERLLDDGVDAALATPTQVLLATWRRHPTPLPERLRGDLEALVREHPANLEKIDQWLGPGEGREDFRRLRPRLETAQRQGTEERRRREFTSSLPR